jgi:hypothetical protein
MIQNIVPPVQEQHRWFFAPAFTAPVQPAMNNIIYTVCPGARTVKTEIGPAMELDAGGLYGREREIEVLQQKLGGVQTQVSSIRSGHAGCGKANGGAINPLADKRNHLPSKFLGVVFNAFSFYHKELI